MTLFSSSPFVIDFIVCCTNIVLYEPHHLANEQMSSQYLRSLPNEPLTRLDSFVQLLGANTKRFINAFIRAGAV